MGGKEQMGLSPPPVFFFMYFKSPYSKKGIDSAYDHHRGFGFVLKTDWFSQALFLLLLFLLCDPQKNFTASLKKTEIRGWNMVTAKEALFSAGTLPACVFRRTLTHRLRFFVFHSNRPNFRTCSGWHVGVRGRLYSVLGFEPPSRTVRYGL